MAVLAIPAAGALIGGALFSWGTTAMSVGWMLGSWLYGATSHSTTPGMKPQSMPNINQALRGSPVFVTFGTNRISAQVVWTKNWKATRQKSSGKGGGKGGGSGGGGSAKGGGSGAQTYTYSWDIGMSFGMPDTPSYIKRGWIGGDAIDEATITTLLAGFPTAQSQIAQNFTGIFGPGGFGSANKPKAKLDFVEAFYGPGFETGSVDLTTWSYFQSQEGVACSWPYTIFLGLKTLQLGQTGMIPQMSFEIGPLDGAQTTYTDNSFINMANPTDVSSSTYPGFNNPQNQAMMVGDDGKHYVIHLTNNKRVLYCIETDASVVLDATYTAARFSEAGSTEGTLTSFIMGAPGTPYFFIVTITALSITYHVYICRVQIHADGSQTGVGFDASTTGGLTQPNIVVAGTANDSFAFFAIDIGISLGNMGRPCILTLPLSGSVDDTAVPASWELRLTTLGFGDYFFDPLCGQVARAQRAGVVINDSGLPGVVCYIGQDLVDNTNSYGHAGAGNALIDGATQPMLVYSQGNSGYTDLSVKFGVPFADSMKKFDGSASTNYVDEYTSPSVIGEGRFLAFLRPYATKAEYYNIRLFGWNNAALLANIPTPLGTHQGRFWDDVANGGVLPGDRDVAYPNEIQLGYDQVTNTAILQATGYGAPLGFAKVYSTLGSIITGSANDVTPPYIIYRILTSTVFGFNVPASRVNQTSYADAVQHCVDQGILVSVTYTTEDNLLSVIDELCSLYGGFLVDDAGIIKFGVVRSTDTPDPIVIDNKRLLSPGKGQPPVMVQKGAVQDGYNKVKMNYIDRQLDYKQNQIEVSDEVDIDINGPRVKEFPATYVMAGSLANMMAERALWTNLYGRDIYSFKLGAKDAHRQPGDVITLVDSYHLLLRGGTIARIMKWKESKRLEFDVQAVQVIPYQHTANHDWTNVTSADPGNNLVSSVMPPLAQRMYEVPKEFQGAKAEVYVGYNQATAIMGAQLYLSFDAGASYLLTQDVQPYIISGMWPQGLENRPNGFCERDVEFYLMPASGFNVATPIFAQTHDLDDVSQGIRAAGGGVLICGSEALAIEELTLLGQNHYRAKRLFRGWGGTPISNHNSGTYWHYHQAGIFNYEITEDKIGTVLYYKVAPYNFAGVVTDLASLTAGSYQIKGLYWLPRVQPRDKTWVQSAINWPRSADIGDRALFNTVSGGCDVTFTWPQAAQAEGFGAGGYGGGGYGHFAADILTPSWRVNVYSTNGFSVRSSVVNTGFFTYDLPTNSADFSGFAQDLWLQITPFTVKGDGPVADVRTLKLFW
jgi:hypothetical protein